MVFFIEVSLMQRRGGRWARASRVTAAKHQGGGRWTPLPNFVHTTFLEASGSSGFACRQPRAPPRRLKGAAAIIRSGPLAGSEHACTPDSYLTRAYQGLEVRCVCPQLTIGEHKGRRNASRGRRHSRGASQAGGDGARELCRGHVAITQWPSWADTASSTAPAQPFCGRWRAGPAAPDAWAGAARSALSAGGGRSDNRAAVSYGSTASSHA